MPLVPRVRRRVLVAATVVAVMATAVAAFASPTAATDTDYFDVCPALILYGSRGSGEPGPNDPPTPGQPDRHGLGLGIWELYVALAATRPAGEVGYVANDYPAVDPVDAIPDVGPYVASVAAGVTSLRADLPAIAAECPTAKIAVVGYSQGADVTRRGVDTLSNPGGRMKVFQLSDPHFDASEPTVAYTGNYDPTWRGLARNLADLGLFTHAPTFRAEWGVESWCHGADLVCQYPGPSPSPSTRRTDPHRSVFLSFCLSVFAGSHLCEPAKTQPPGRDRADRGDHRPAHSARQGPAALLRADLGGPPGRRR